MRRLVWIVVLGAALYAAGYIVFRQAHAEVWSRDQRSYVMYPQSPGFWYFLFRPAAYLDERLTGMRSHRGPHR